MAFFRAAKRLLSDMPKLSTMQIAAPTALVSCGAVSFAHVKCEATIAPSLATASVATIDSGNVGGFVAAGGVQPPAQFCQLSDGRVIAYHVEILGKGDEKDAVPVLGLHGMAMGNRLGLHPSETDAFDKLKRPVAMICIDRPGYGATSPPPANYSYGHFVKDMAEFLQKIPRAQHKPICVLGQSSGGPNAMALCAMADELPFGIAAAAIVSSDPPYYHLDAPDALTKCTRALDLTPAAPTIDGNTHCPYGMPLIDFVEQNLVPFFSAKGVAGKGVTWSGVYGFMNDFTLERMPWPFKVENITLGDKLTIWVGEKDVPCILEGAPFIHALIKRSNLMILPDEDHFYITKPHFYAAILEKLVDEWDAQYRDLQNSSDAANQPDAPTWSVR